MRVCMLRVMFVRCKGSSAGCGWNIDDNTVWINASISTSVYI